MIRLALIGNGRWGKVYLETAKKIPDCEIKYIVTHNYQELLQYTDIDGIIIATPAETHFEIIQTFPKYHLLVEKPLTTSFKDALKIKNNNIMVGHIYLYNLALQAGLKMFGPKRAIVFELLNTSNYNSNNIVWELAPHGVSFIIDLLGMPKGVFVKGNKDDVHIELLYDLFRSIIHCKWDNPTKEREIRVYGDKQILRFNDSQPQEITPLENELRHFINFIKTGFNKTPLEHGRKVVQILEIIDRQLQPYKS